MLFLFLVYTLSPEWLVPCWLPCWLLSGGGVGLECVLSFQVGTWKYEFSGGTLEDIWNNRLVSDKWSLSRVDVI